jgi:biotin operon repressor
MVVKSGLSKDVILHLFRNPTSQHTISSLTEELKRSRVGVWKTVKELEKNGFVTLSSIELIRKKVYTVELNWENSVVEKSIEIYLLNEVLNYEDWTKNFNNLGNVLDFLFLCKEEDNIKIVGITQKGKFVRIQKPADLQESNGKEITTLSITNLEFLQGLKNKKNEYMDAVKKGIVLFGQGNFIQFIKKMHK